MQFADGTVVPLINAGVLVLPDSFTALTPAVNDAAPIHGADGRQNVSWDTLHARFDHRSLATLSRLPLALRDAPRAWKQVLARPPPSAPCDACLRAHADVQYTRAHIRRL